MGGDPSRTRPRIAIRRPCIAALGTSGTARGVPHLHLGLLLDNEVEQDDWTFILREGEVRAVLGGYKNGEVLSKT